MSRNIQTHEYFMSKISENYEPINIYTGSQEKITCICKICGSEKTAKAAEFMRKRIICRTCNPIMKYTPESFKEVLKEKNPTIIPLEDYNGTNTKIKFQCAICGYTFNTTPYNVERGSLCRKCYGTALKTNEEFLQELKEKNPNLIALSEYRGANSRMLFHCNICNYE